MHFCRSPYYDIGHNIWVRVMVFNASFNNISVMSWKPEDPEKTTDLTQVTDKLYHIMLYRVHFATSRAQTRNVSGVHHAITELELQTLYKTFFFL